MKNKNAKTDKATIPLKPEAKPAPKELGGREGPDPTRYGDWELKGKCVDF